MAVDATGPVTTNGIPTYLTGSDAPSGKGLNNIVAAIDTLITTALKTVLKKAGTTVAARRAINFIDGTNVTVTVADDAVNDTVNVTINGAPAPVGLIVGLGG